MKHSHFHHLLKNLLSRIEFSHAIRWTLLTQGFRLLTGPLTMILTLKYLDVETQGYMYTFISVLGISIFLEMGFSQNILQFASHEFAKLKFTENNTLEGDEVAHSRLISLGRLAIKYYGIAATIFLLILLIGGSWFFSTSAQVGVKWGGPWVLVCISGSISLLLNPCWAILEGCNQIAEIEKFRFFSSLCSFVVMTGGLLSGAGLYAICFSSLVNLLLSGCYLFARWRDFLKMFFTLPKFGVISWRNEIWPFQWKIALSWVCGYFIFTIITPTVFRMAGPAAAARTGFTLQLARLVASVASSWSITKLPELGILVARRDWALLASVWKKATVMNVGITVLGSICLICSMEVITQWIPDLSIRYAGWLAASCFCLSMIAQAFTSSFAYYLRAFKEEPFVWLSILNAILSFTMIVGFTLIWQESGAAIGYLLSTLVILPFAWRIYALKSRQYRSKFEV